MYIFKDLVGYSLDLHYRQATTIQAAHHSGPLPPPANTWSYICLAGDHMIKPSKTINVRIPAELQKELLVISRQEKIPVSDLVRESLHEFLAVRRFRQLRKQTLSFAEVQGLGSDEDILRLKSGR